MLGPDSVTTVRSVTKCIQILSPGKRSSLIQFLGFNIGT